MTNSEPKKVERDQRKTATGSGYDKGRFGGHRPPLQKTATGAVALQRERSTVADRRYKKRLPSRVTLCNAERFFDRHRVVHLSAFEHGSDVANVANILSWIAID